MLLISLASHTLGLGVWLARLVVDPVIKKHSMPKILPIAMAEGDDDRENHNIMTDSGNSQIHLLKLFLRLLN